jgi:hypothetical protein
MRAGFGRTRVCVIFTKGEIEVTNSCVIARLNARVRPLDRCELWEEPLQEILVADGLGKVIGGGTQLGPLGEIMYCDVELGMRDASDMTLHVVADALTALGAPKGSRLLSGGDSAREIAFGQNEGLAVYLNGAELPQEVYEQTDVNFVWSEFDRLLGSGGRIYSYWEGPTETALYMYGPSFETMKQRISQFMAAYPLCRKSRAERIA